MGQKRKHSDAEPTAWVPTAVVPESPAVGHVADADQRFRTLYAKPRDFKELARRDADFAAVVKGRELDFNDPAAVMQLTKTLLRLDFQLTIDLPDDRLCPPVANRHNYILWLKGLMDTTSYSPPGRKLVGLDIGTGASCIYPLLGCSQRPWSFIATDVDGKNLEYARRNVRLNNLEGRIKIVARKPDDELIGLDRLGLDSIDFCMTNPPFYESEDEMLRSAAQKNRPPSTACTGHEVEMVAAGGEVGFVGRILSESLILRDRVQWYTAMFGFLSSVTHVLKALREERVANVAVTEFVQGSKTRRWAVAWSFLPMRPAQSVARGTAAVQAKALLPPPTEVEVATLSLPDGGVGKFADALSGAVGGLELVSWDWDSERLEGTGRSVGNVWNRAWRRRRKLEKGRQEEGGALEKQGVQFGFRVWVRVRRDGVSVSCRWLEGEDVAVFDSFQGYVKATSESAYK